MLDPHAPLRSLPPLALIASLGLALAPAGAAAQIPDEFVNLQQLPQDISKDELVATMRGWAEDLGVRCGHCHVGPDDLQGMDFATDEREAKEVTREMLVLTRAINHDYLKDPQAGEDVTCHTCHHGMPSPPRAVAEEMERAARQRGVEGSIERFRELHRYHYGRGRYDLGDRSLVEIASGLVGAGKHDDALQLLAFGLELFPESAEVHAGYGHAYVAMERTEEARASFEKALELDRRNRSARLGLRALESGTDQ